jgi:hypothetical protein
MVALADRVMTTDFDALLSGGSELGDDEEQHTRLMHREIVRRARSLRPAAAAAADV